MLMACEEKSEPIRQTYCHSKEALPLLDLPSIIVQSDLSLHSLMKKSFNGIDFAHFGLQKQKRNGLAVVHTALEKYKFYFKAKFIED